MFDLSQWLILAPALILAILSGYLSERVGIVNIAINGMMIFGAMFFNIFSNVFYQQFNGDLTSDEFNNTFIVSVFLSGILSTMIGVLFGFAVIKLKCDHVIGGTGINLIAPGVGLIISDNIPSIFPGQTGLANKYVSSYKIGDVFGESVVCFVVISILIAAIFIFMTYTKYGLRYKSIGENPNTVDSQGINVIKYKWIGIIVASFIAAIAGSLYSYSTPGGIFNGDVSGLGFIALALLIVSSWKILPSIIIGAGFAALYVFSSNAINISDEYRYLLRIVPFAVTLIVMIVFGKFSIGPKSVGKHFIKEAR